MTTTYKDILNKFFPISIDMQNEQLGEFIKDLTIEDLVWISENRDFAETERYNVKESVDKALDSSDIINSERKSIEQLFQTKDSVNAAKIYNKMLMKNLTNLNSAYISILKDTSSYNLCDYKEMWEKLRMLSDIDNAHAMYLSSDNWSFSVFHKLIEELEKLIGDDFEILSILLTAGIQDVRTFAYNTLSGDYYDENRVEYVENLIRKKDYIRSNGIVPLVAYKIATKQKESVISEQDIAARYDAARERMMGKLDGEKKVTLNNLLTTYQTLYAARTAYDIYEYFGFYAFIRHAVILNTYKYLLKHVSKEIAEQFHYLASTYQFSEIPKFS